jgi:hypothetical protein
MRARASTSRWSTPTEERRGCELVLRDRGDGTFLAGRPNWPQRRNPVLESISADRLSLARPRPNTSSACWSHVIAATTRLEDRWPGRGGPDDGQAARPGVGRSTRPAWRRPRLGRARGGLCATGVRVSQFGCDGVQVSTPTGRRVRGLGGRPVLVAGPESILLVPNNATPCSPADGDQPGRLVPYESRPAATMPRFYCDGRRNMYACRRSARGDPCGTSGNGRLDSPRSRSTGAQLQ